jgi:O-glycosyl hydrolase
MKSASSHERPCRRLPGITLLLSCLFFPSLLFAQSATVTLHRTTKYQTIWGFGAAANHPVKYLAALPDSHPNKALILDRLFGLSGSNAGLSIVRLEINCYTKDKDPDQATFMPAPGVYDWDTDHHQRWFAQEAKNRGMTQFYAVPWSPPAWMKGDKNFHLPGHEHGGRLLSSKFQAFAAYLRSYVYRYKAVHGFDIKWISVQNEPDLVDEERYASCHYNISEMNDVASLVADAIHGLNNDLGWDVKVGAPEASVRGWAQWYLGSAGLSAATRAKLDFYPVHDYMDSEDVWISSGGKPVFNAEVCNHTQLNDPSIVDGLRWGKKIAAALKRGEPGWMYWWCVADPTDITGQGLINMNQQGDFFVNKRLYVMGQFSRYLRPGHFRFLAASNNGEVISVGAQSPSTGVASVVLINDSTSTINTRVNGFTFRTVAARRTSATEDLAKLPDMNVVSGGVTISLPPKSVTSLVEF